MTTAIEPLAREDVDAVCALAREIWRAHYPPIIGGAQTEYMLAQRYDPQVVQSELEHDGVWWDVLREDGSIVAFASTLRTATPDELKIDKLYVHPQRQRRGHGALLIEHNVERARALGLRHVVLAVNKHNYTAIAAYRKHGFGVRDAVVKEIGGGFVMDDYVMVKNVSDNANRSS